MPAMMNSCLEMELELEEIFSKGSGVAMVVIRRFKLVNVYWVDYLVLRSYLDV